MWFIGVEVEQETSAPPPKKNPGSAPAVQNSMDRFGPTGKVSKKAFEVDQFSRSDRLEFWLNGSRPVKLPRPQAYCFNKK